ncbi:PQQ-binding-like beta-propeller repeat protein [bacterium]|nr:PQQ-binding-like beta-propeller repeat protein [bacterium]
MTEKRISQISAGLFTAIAIWTLAWWFSTDPTSDFVVHGPGMDNRDSLSVKTAKVDIGAQFARFTGTAADLPGFWPRFRGAYYDNISMEALPVSNSWENARDPLWSVPLGEGHAAPVVAGGRVYVLDYLEQEKADALRCFSLADGREIWRRWYPVRIKRNHGMSRTIPAVADSFVVTIGPRCHVMCVHAESGRLFWGLDLEEEYETEVPFWYTGQCPLIDGGTAVLAPGGKALMIGVDCATGVTLWETPNPESWTMSHSSIMPMTLRGHSMYVYCFNQGVAGISAEEESRGRLLWQCTAWSHSVIAPSPLFLGDNRILLTAGYGAGSMVIQIQENDSLFSAVVLQSCAPDSGFASEQQTPLLYRNAVFGVLPKDAGPVRNQFVCADASDITRFKWTSGPANRFGLGPYLIADDKIVLLNDDGHLTVLKASLNAFEVVVHTKVLSGHDAWGPMALAGSRLLLRDSRQLVCIDLLQ